jgi:putative methyltransferase (TIGR04325 family)
MIFVKKAFHLSRDMYRYLTFSKCYASFRGVFDTFAQAEKSAPPNMNIGYNHSHVAEEYVNHLDQKLHSYDYPILFWLKDIVKPGCKILDFGGNIGNHFFAYRNYIDFPDDLNWIVLDLPEIVKAGAKLLKNEPQLSFVTSLDSIPNPNVILASGILQYIDYKHFFKDFSRNPDHIIINRLPLYSGSTFVTLQNGGTTFYPNYVFNQDDFIKTFIEAGYRLVDLWDDDVDSCLIPFHPLRSLPNYHGLYFRSF